MAYVSPLYSSQEENIHPSSAGDSFVRESTPHTKYLEFLYSNRLGRFLRPALTAKSLPSTLAGMYCDIRFSKHNIPRFIDAYGIDLSEYEKEDPKEYDTFNDFFARKIKRERRPIESNPLLFCSPADSKVSVIENILYLKEDGATESQPHLSQLRVI